MAHGGLGSLPVSLSQANGLLSNSIKSEVCRSPHNGGDYIVITHEDGQHVLLPTALAQQLTQYTPGGILPSSTLMKKARKRAPNWSNEEQACLVSIWSAPEMQEKFKKATRKWPLWEEMGKLLERAGFYGRDAKQCEALMHRLKSTYYRCVNHNRQPGNEPQYCAFYSEIDAVLSQKDACKSYVESDEESRVSEGELHLDGTGESDEEKGNNGTMSQDNLKQFVEQLAESQLQSQFKSGYPTSLLSSQMHTATSTPNSKLGNVDYMSLMKLLRADTTTNNCKTSPKMADSTTMSPPMSMPRATPQNNKRPRASSPLVSLSTEDYLQSIITQSQLHALTSPARANKFSNYSSSLQDLSRATVTSAAAAASAALQHPHNITAHDLERVCSAITGTATNKLLEYLQARDQAFLTLSEKRIKLEEERERKRIEREAEIELKRHQLIVKVCELISNKCSTMATPVPMATTEPSLSNGSSAEGSELATS